MRVFELCRKGGVLIVLMFLMLASLLETRAAVLLWASKFTIIVWLNIYFRI